MLAARAHQGETDLRLEEVDRPTAGPGEVLIKVASGAWPRACSPCGSWGATRSCPARWATRRPARSRRSARASPSSRPATASRLHPNLSCGACEYCLTDREQMCSAHSVLGQGIFGADAMPLHQRYVDGALAEYVLAPVRLVDPLPEAISFDVAAKVHDIADAVRVWRTAAVPPGGTAVFTPPPGRSARRRSAWRGSSASGG